MQYECYVCYLLDMYCIQQDKNKHFQLKSCYIRKNFNVAEFSYVLSEKCLCSGGTIII
jgi:hypothetical protein